MPARREPGFIARFAADDRLPIPERLLLIAAHPDDETLGLGAQLHRCGDLVILHLTDGAPRDVRHAGRHGFADPRSYAAARARELDAALRAGGVRARRISFGLPDQGAHDLGELTRRVAALVDALRPAAVITHCYEGGHPDHDAAAFAAQLAVLAAPQEQAPERIETPGYHAGAGQVTWGRFLERADAPGTAIALSAAEMERKSAMIACFETQRHVLSLFPADVEALRAAPRYDFEEPPHMGPLGYELLGFGPAFEHWRRRATAALAQPV